MLRLTRRDGYILNRIVSATRHPQRSYVLRLTKHERLNLPTVSFVANILGYCEPVTVDSNPRSFVANKTSVVTSVVLKSFIAGFASFSSASPTYAGIVAVGRPVIPEGYLDQFPRALVLLFHTRHLAPVGLGNVLPHPAGDHPRDRGGLELKRVSSKVGTTRPLHLVEKILATSLTIILTRDAPYTVLALVDDIYPHYHEPSDEGSLPEIILPDKNSWQSAGIIPCGRCSGVAQFLATVLAIMKTWETGWLAVMDEIDKLVSVNVGRTLTTTYL